MSIIQPGDLSAMEAEEFGINDLDDHVSLVDTRNQHYDYDELLQMLDEGIDIDDLPNPIDEIIDGHFED